jgi:hypothetical protein
LLFIADGHEDTGINADVSLTFTTSWSYVCSFARSFLVFSLNANLVEIIGQEAKKEDITTLRDLATLVFQAKLKTTNQP